MTASTMPTHPTRTRQLVWAIALAGVAMRLGLAVVIPPGGGDPTFSYGYRAMLLLDGQWDALWLMWHPPGQSILLAIISGATRGLLSPWWAGTAVSLGSTAGLILTADRLLAPRVRHDVARLAAAALLACNESLIHWQQAPLTEPLFLWLLLLTIALYDRETIDPTRACIAGLVLGAGTLFRLEGVVVAAGVCAYTAWRTRSVRATLLFALGWLVVAGWLVGHVEYLERSFAAQRSVYTIPAAMGLLANLTRAVEAFHRALTAWLPQVLLLPFWMLLAIGAWHLSRRDDANGRRLNALFAATLLPQLAAVILSIMHKRTGAFLIAPATIWTAVALDRAIDGPRSGSATWRRAAVIGGVALACALDLGRVGVTLRCASCGDFVTDEVRVLRAHATVRGKIWAYGSEPSLYSLLNWPERYDFWNRLAVYGPVADDRGPADLVASLRAQGYRYLVLLVPSGDEPIATQPSWFGHQPQAAVVRAVVADAAQLGLRPLGGDDTGVARVRVFEIEAAQ